MWIVFRFEVTLIFKGTLKLYTTRGITFHTDDDFNKKKFHIVKVKCITREGKVCAYDVTCAQMTSHQNGDWC